MTLRETIQDLEKKIQNSFNGITTVEAESLAAQFLYGQILVSAELTRADLDARMRKTGTKAIRAAVYMGAEDKAEKKLTEAGKEAVVTTNDMVQKEQDALDKAEVSKAELERLYDTFKTAVFFYTAVMKSNSNV